MATEIAKQILQHKSYVNAARVTKALECCLAPEDYARWREDLQNEIVITFVSSCLLQLNIFIDQCISVPGSTEEYGGRHPSNNNQGVLPPQFRQEWQVHSDMGPH
jgi:hypothetical protein